jgi:SAM-dependent methyltransferase
VRGKRVLDIGSSDGRYLRLLDAGQKVALDIALPFLHRIPHDSGILRVCADAENLPFAPHAFDVIIVSDVLEHVLDPERVVQRIRLLCRPETRLIVHVPWRDDLSKYADSPYEFTHLRSFDEYSFGLLFRDFSLVRERQTHPSLEEPIVFRLRPFLPLRLYDRLVDRYFHGGLAEREYVWRKRWIAELPRRERLLLLVYPAKFRMCELRLRSERIPLRRRLSEQAQQLRTRTH